MGRGRNLQVFSTKLSGFISNPVTIGMISSQRVEVLIYFHVNVLIGIFLLIQKLINSLIQPVFVFLTIRTRVSTF